MPYNGSGTFTLPAGNPVVTGTTISSTTTNATNTDIANGLSNAVTRNGQSPATANLPMGGFKLTGLGEGTTAGESVAYGGSPAFANVTLTAANSTANGGGQLYLNGATGNRIDFATTGVAAPAFTTRSLGTKIVLYPGITAAAVDFAMGIENSTLWTSVPTSATYQFKWYGGTTVAATLSGAGEFTPIKALRGCYGAGAQNTNFAAGDGALDSNTSGYNNVAIGKDALTDNTTGAFNVAMGRAALSQNINGTDNIAIGNEALLVGTSPDLNIAIGTSALTNCSGNSNVAIGYLAGSGVLGGSNNVIIGGDDGTGAPISTSGSNNIVLADGAGNVRAYYTNSTSSWTIPNKFAVAGALTITGANALRGSYGAGAITSNFAAGDRALDSNSIGTDNTAAGVDALTANGNGIQNSAFGSSALFKNNNGTTNVAVGASALYNNVAGDQNVACGAFSLLSTTGSTNTAVGYFTAQGLTTGSYNQVLGDNITLAAASTGRIGIGSSFTHGVNTSVIIGNGTNRISNAYTVNATWAFSSDERLKNVIGKDTLGLSFINDLEPVTYRWKPSNEIPKELTAHYTEVNVQDTNIVMHGLIAQNVKAALDKAGVDTFTGWAEDEDGTQRLGMADLITPMINAIKELTARLEALEGTL